MTQARCSELDDGTRVGTNQRVGQCRAGDSGLRFGGARGSRVCAHGAERTGTIRRSAPHSTRYPLRPRDSAEVRRVARADCRAADRSAHRRYNTGACRAASRQPLLIVAPTSSFVRFTTRWPNHGAHVGAALIRGVTTVMQSAVKPRIAGRLSASQVAARTSPSGRPALRSDDCSLPHSDDCCLPTTALCRTLTTALCRTLTTALCRTLTRPDAQGGCLEAARVHRVLTRR